VKPTLIKRTASRPRLAAATIVRGHSDPCHADFAFVPTAIRGRLMPLGSGPHPGGIVDNSPTSKRWAMGQCRPTRIFHTLPALAASMSLTPCFSWVWKRHQRKNSFNGLSHPVETVKTVLRRTKPLFTQLKQGLNERGLIRRASSYEICRLSPEETIEAPYMCVNRPFGTELLSDGSPNVETLGYFRMEFGFWSHL